MARGSLRRVLQVTFLCLALIVVPLSAVQLLKGLKKTFATDGSDLQNIIQLLLGFNEDGSTSQVEAAMVSVQGSRKQKMRQFYKDVWVYGTSINTEVLPQVSNIIDSTFFIGLNTDLLFSFWCTLSDSEGISITLDHFNLIDSVVTKSMFDNLIYVTSDNKAHNSLGVELFVVKINGFTRPYAYIDKCTRRVLDSFDRGGYQVPINGQMASSTSSNAAPAIPQTATFSSDGCDVQGQGGNPNRPIQYGQSPFCLSSLTRYQDGQICSLENDAIVVVNCYGSDLCEAPDIGRFNCTLGLNYSVNGGSSPMLDVFFFASKTAQMYKDLYNFDPLQGYVPLAKVHCVSSINAYWDGESLLFSDGDGVSYHPLTGCDTVAHEYSHGLTERASNLAYRYQSGGINEAFSDMAGEAAEDFIFGKNMSDWLVGREMFIGGGKAVRYFKDPTLDGVSIKHVNDYRSYLDVHFTSGVYNYVFYLLSQDIGTRAAFECFLNANRLYWTETTTFETGACGTLRGAYDAGYPMDIVAKAFVAVGIKFTNCKDISKLVTVELQNGVNQTGLSISDVRNPLFKVNVPVNVNRLTISVSSPDVRIFVASLYNRTATPIAAAFGAVTASVKSSTTVYARFAIVLPDLERKNVSAVMTFN
ncbi:unnamed protein product [Lymnaea stagnalis]|uniref:Neutral metalloproteinase n=1 Tax=Lymnaea stagnalis TaxID=6523 RepID=A0AAV2HKU9_LYMST